MIADTNTYLLMGLKDQGNDRVWAEFCARYRPVIVAFARHLGLSDDEAQDAAQDTLIAFADAYRRGQYDREKGRLRTWLHAIARNQIHYRQRRAGRHRSIQSEDKTQLLEAIPDTEDFTSIWEGEWQKALVTACLKHVSRYLEQTTMQAFDLFVLQELPADQVAARLGITRNAVFKAKRRVLSHLREAYRCLESFW